MILIISFPKEIQSIRKPNLKKYLLNKLLDNSEKTGLWAYAYVILFYIYNLDTRYIMKYIITEGIINSMLILSAGHKNIICEVTSK